MLLGSLTVLSKVSVRLALDGELWNLGTEPSSHEAQHCLSHISLKAAKFSESAELKRKAHGSYALKHRTFPNAEPNSYCSYTHKPSKVPETYARPNNPKWSHRAAPTHRQLRSAPRRRCAAWTYPVQIGDLSETPAPPDSATYLKLHVVGMMSWGVSGVPNTHERS